MPTEKMYEEPQSQETETRGGCCLHRFVSRFMACAEMQKTIRGYMEPYYWGNTDPSPPQHPTLSGGQGGEIYFSG
jgi:hypothetical protein